MNAVRGYNQLWLLRSHYTAYKFLSWYKLAALLALDEDYLDNFFFLFFLIFFLNLFFMMELENSRSQDTIAFSFVNILVTMQSWLLRRYGNLKFRIIR